MSPDRLRHPTLIQKLSCRELIQLFFNSKFDQITYFCREGLTRSPQFAQAHNKCFKNNSRVPESNFLPGGLGTLINGYCCNHFGESKDAHQEALRIMMDFQTSSSILFVSVVEESELTASARGAIAELRDKWNNISVVHCPASELSSYFGVNGGFTEGSWCGRKGRD